jgi:hypothetical protein
MKGNAVLWTATWCAVFLALVAVAYGTDRAHNSPSEPSGIPTVGLTPFFETAMQAGAAAQPDEDEKLDEQFGRFGMAAGAAYQCTSAANMEKFKSDIRRVYTRIGQLFGTDRAFLFAMNFGTATDKPFDKARCPELLKKLRESVFVRGLVAQ